MSQNQSDVLSIISIHPLNRTEKQIMTLCEITDNIAFFSNLINEKGKYAHVLCCRYMTQELCPAGETVFKIGSKADKFYIILEGEVGIQIFCPQKEKSANLRKESIHYNLIEVNVLRKGESFGEYGLLNDRPRTATIIAKKNCIFGVLNKKIFQSIISDVKRKEFEEKIKFLHGLTYFSGMTKGTIATLIYHLFLKKFKRNDVVYLEKEPADQIYIINSGQFTISKEIKINRSYPLFQRSFSLYNESNLLKSCELAILSKGEIFGEEDIISNNTRQYTAKCYSMEGEVYLISKKDFMNRFAFLKDNKEKSLFESFKLHSLNKIEIYSQKINQFSNIITNNRSFIIGSFQTKLNHIQYKEQEKIQTNKYKTNKYVINDFNDAEKYINKKTLISTKINGFFNENQENSIFPVSNPNKKHRKLRPASNLIQNTKNTSQTPSKRFFKYLDLQLSLTPKSRNNGLDGLLRNLFKK